MYTHIDLYIHLCMETMLIGVSADHAIHDRGGRDTRDLCVCVHIYIYEYMYAHV